MKVVATVIITFALGFLVSAWLTSHTAVVVALNSLLSSIKASPEASTAAASWALVVISVVAILPAVMAAAVAAITLRLESTPVIVLRVLDERPPESAQRVFIAVNTTPSGKREMVLAAEHEWGGVGQGASERYVAIDNPGRTAAVGVEVFFDVAQSPTGTMIRQGHNLQQLLNGKVKLTIPSVPAGGTRFVTISNGDETRFTMRSPKVAYDHRLRRFIFWPAQLKVLGESEIRLEARPNLVL
ncbi:MAG: hypothetical protein ABSE64_16620 [Vulcanimicrobiaceae bacterium]|jgi:hypothetical protein